MNTKRKAFLVGTALAVLAAVVGVICLSSGLFRESARPKRPAVTKQGPEARKPRARRRKRYPHLEKGVRVVVCSYRSLGRERKEIAGGLRRALSQESGLHLVEKDIPLRRVTDRKLLLSVGRSFNADILVVLRGFKKDKSFTCGVCVYGVRSTEGFSSEFRPKERIEQELAQLAAFVMQPIRALREKEETIRGAKHEADRGRALAARGRATGLVSLSVVEDEADSSSRVVIVTDRPPYGEAIRESLRREGDLRLLDEGRIEAAIHKTGLAVEQLAAPENRRKLAAAFGAKALVVVETRVKTRKRARDADARIIALSADTGKPYRFLTWPRRELSADAWPVVAMVRAALRRPRGKAALKRPQRADVAPSRKPRLALIPASPRDTHADAIIAQLEASLSSRGVVQLVERNEITKVLAEHELSLSGLAAAKDAAKVGALLNADMLLILENADSTLARGGNKAGGLWRIRAVECKSGIILRSAILPQSELLLDVSAAVGIAESAAKKWRAGPSQRRYVSLLGFRSEEPGRSLLGLAEALGIFLITDLVESPDVVVLEREELRRLTFERDLTSAELSLKASAVLLEGGVRHGEEKGKSRITVALKPLSAASSKQAVVEAPLGDVAGMRKLVGEAVLKELGAQPPALLLADPRLEAALFLRQAKNSLSHGDLRQAGQAAEAALALHPSRSARRIAGNLWRNIAFQYESEVRRIGHGEIPALAPHMIGAAARATELANLERRSKIDDLRKGRSPRKGVSFLPHSFLYDVCDPDELNARECAELNPQAWRQWLDLQRLHVDAYRDMLAFYKEKGRKEGRPYLARSICRECLGACKFWTEDPSEWRELLREALDGLKRATARGGKASSKTHELEGWQPIGLTSETDPLEERCTTALAVRCIPRHRGVIGQLLKRPVPFLKPGAKAVEREIIQLTTRHDDPLVRIAGCELAWRHSFPGDPRYPKLALDTYIQSFPPEHRLHRLRWRLFPQDAILDALRAIQHDRRLHLEYCQKLFGPMLRPEHADTLARWDEPFMSFVLTLRSGREYEKAGEWVSRAIQVMSWEHVKESYTHAERFRKKLETARTELAALAGREPGRELGRDPKAPAQWRGFMAKQIRIAGFAYHLDDYLYVHENRFVIVTIPGASRSGARSTADVRVTTVPLSGGRQEVVGSVTVRKQPNVHGSPVAAFEGDDIYVAVLSSGLIRFVKGETSLWNEANGLPTNYFLAIACLNGKVYLGTGPACGRPVAGSIVEFDPKTTTFSVLCSSGAVEKRSPLDGGKAYSVTALLADRKRRCLWFRVRQKRGEEAARAGVWQLNPRTKKLSRAAQPPKDVARLLTRRRSRLSNVNPTGLQYSPCGRELTYAKVILDDPSTKIFAAAGLGEVWLLRPAALVKPGDQWVAATAGYKARKIEAWRRYYEGRPYAFRASAGGRYGDPTELAKIGITQFSRAIELMPDCAEFYLRRGKLHRQQKNYQQAIADASKAIELYPDYVEACRERGLAYYHLKQFEKAEADLKKCLQITPWDRAARGRLRSVRAALQQSRADPALLARAESVIQREYTNMREKVRAISTLLATGEPGIQVKAANALANIGPEANDAVPGLLKAIRSNSLETRRAVVWALAGIGSTDKAVVAPLVAVLEDQRNPTSTRAPAATALGKVGPPAAEAVPALVRLLGDDNEHARRAAVKALGKIGPAAQNAIAAVEKALHDVEPGVCSAAALAHWRITGKTHKAMPVLLKGLNSRDFGDRLVALNVARQFGPAGKEAVPALMNALQARDKLTRFVAAIALGEMGQFDRVSPQVREEVRRTCYRQGIAFEEVGNFRAALVEFDLAVRWGGKSYHQGFGARARMRFFLGDFEGAEKDFLTYVALRPDRVYFALFAYIASARAGRPNRQTLRLVRSKMSTETWPGAAVKLFAEEMSPQECLKIASAPDPRKNRQQLCEAHFHVAHYYLIKGDRERAREHLKKCLATGLKGFIEYAGAKAELSHLAQD